MLIPLRYSHGTSSSIALVLRRYGGRIWLVKRNRLPALVHPLVVHPRLADRSLRWGFAYCAGQMAVANDQTAARLIVLMGVLRHVLLDFLFDGALQHLAGSITKNLIQHRRGNYYGLAKVGINGLTQQLATELGGQNIRVNAIAPARSTPRPTAPPRRRRWSPTS